MAVLETQNSYLNRNFVFSSYFLTTKKPASRSYNYRTVIFIIFGTKSPTVNDLIRKIPTMKNSYLPKSYYEKSYHQ